MKSRKKKLITRKYPKLISLGEGDPRFQDSKIPRFQDSKIPKKTKIFIVYIWEKEEKEDQVIVNHLAWVMVASEALVSLLHLEQ